MKLFKILLLLMFALMATTAHCASETRATTHIKSQVLQQDTIWSGNIIIEGVIVVGRGITLTIKPGSNISFKRIDSNNDDIGDSEIRVLGHISAVGTKESPILFSSAEKNPSPKDWSYLLIFSSASFNKIEFCTFKYAFSGVQVHFSTALLSNNIFTKNQEGIRFGRAKLTVRNNTFHNNHIGIRFTRMEGPVEISHNEITQNSTGIFLVPSGQNIVNFFEPGRAGKPWNEGHLLIINNNIYQNYDYNLKLGAKQMWDIQISNNWWGSKDIKKSHETIYDNHSAADLGRAILQPISKTAISNAGAKRVLE